MMLGYLTCIHMRYVSASCAHEKPKGRGITHTPSLVLGGCHFALSPFGPNIECLERVSSFGRWKFKDLQEESKQAKPKRNEQYYSTSTRILVRRSIYKGISWY
jgi:hypothetical protein